MEPNTLLWSTQAVLAIDGLVFLWALALGVLKYRQILASPEHRAHPYTDIAHRAALLYSFAILLIAAFVQISAWPQAVNLVAALVVGLNCTPPVPVPDFSGNVILQMTTCRLVASWEMPSVLSVTATKNQEVSRTHKIQYLKGPAASGAENETMVPAVRVQAGDRVVAINSACYCSRTDFMARIENFLLVDEWILPATPSLLRELSGMVTLVKRISTSGRDRGKEAGGVIGLGHRCVLWDGWNFPVADQIS